MSGVALQSFGFGDHLVRLVDRAGEAWFVGNDVCGALEISNPRDAMGRLDDDERDCVGITDAMGRDRETTVVSESGVYALIFTSRKPVAKQFRKWVTGEVLPTLRRTGQYELPQPDNDLPPEYRAPRLGTRDDRDAIRVAVWMVREMKDLYGQQAGRQMWVRLGFPMPDLDLEPAPVGHGEPPEQVEGDVHLWGVAMGLKESRTGATHEGELYRSYVAWCARGTAKPMGPERFGRMMVAMFGHEEHPEMIRVVATRRGGLGV